MMLAVVSDDSPEFRERHAADQRLLIEQMCRETGLTMSALATEAGVHSSTVTRSTRIGNPVKWDTFFKLVKAYVIIMGGRRKNPSPNIVRYVAGLGMEIHTGQFIERVKEGGDPQEYLRSTVQDLDNLTKSVAPSQKEEASTKREESPSALAAAQLRVAIAIANDEFEAGLSDEDVSGIASFVSELYPIIMIVENIIGRPIDPRDKELLARIRRAWARRESK
jgi:hypothetical protein